MGFAMITMSEAAQGHIASLLADHPDTAGLRLSLKTGGCAGMEYKLDIADETKLRSGFVFKNPNEVSACGCGEAVELKKAPAGAARA